MTMASGVMPINNKTKIADAFTFAKAAYPSGWLIIEKYMDGPELSTDAVVYK